MSGVAPVGAFLLLLSELEGARAAEQRAAATVDYWDASEIDAPPVRDAAATVYAEARAARISVERAAEAALAALPDAAARRAALYAAGVR